jgi:hypothetical protein
MPQINLSHSKFPHKTKMLNTHDHHHDQIFSTLMYGAQKWSKKVSQWILCCFIGHLLPQIWTMIKYESNMRFEALTVAMMLIFWFVALFTLIRQYQHFRETYCHHFQPWRCTQYASLKCWLSAYKSTWYNNSEQQ